MTDDSPVPTVSIIIPCHNASRWLGETLASALAQTHPRTEIIVVDDGSKDDSLELARSYVHRGIQVATQPNRGASSARNHGLRLARGAYIQFLDADDLLATQKIARQVAALADAPPRTLAAGEWGAFTTSPEAARFNPEAVYAACNGVEFLQLHYETGAMMQPAGWLAPRILLESAGPWNETLSLNDDGEYFARVMLKADGIRFVPGARCYYRAPTGGNLSQRRDRAALGSLYRSVELTTSCLLRADRSPRTVRAVALAWKWTAFELFPGAPDLSRTAEGNCHSFGGRVDTVPGGPRFQLLARLLGWRLAKRMKGWVARQPRPVALPPALPPDFSAT